MKYQYILNSAIASNQVIVDPMGWDDASFELKRDKSLHGVFYDFSLALKYVKDGYTHVKTAYETYGVQADVTLTVKASCNGEPFAEVFTGKLNFSKYEEVDGDVCYVSIPADPAGAVMKVKNRMEISVPITMSDSLTLPGVAIIKSSKAIQDISEETGTYSTSYPIPGNSLAIESEEISYFQFGYETLEMEEAPMLDNSITLQEVASPASVPVLFTAEEDGQYTFNFNLQFVAALSIRKNAGITHNNANGCAEDSTAEYQFEQYQLQLLLIEPAGSTYTITNENFSGCFKEVKSITINSTSSVTYNMTAGQTIKVYAQLRTKGTYNNTNLIDTNVVHTHQLTLKLNNELKITIPSTYPATTTNYARLQNAAQTIVDNITDGELDFTSDYFKETGFVNGCGSMIAFTTGKTIRQFPGETLNMSLKQLFDGLNCIFNAGLSVQTGVVKIEPVKAFYDDTYISSFVNAGDLKIKFDETLCANKLEIGYSKWEAEEYSGLDEFNSRREYSNGLSQFKGTITKICEWVTGRYAIEVTRREAFVNAGSKDFKYDNDIFAIALMYSGGTLVVERGNISSADNINDPANALNFRLSPLRMAINWFKSMAVGFIDHTAAVLTWKKGDGNYLAKGYVNNGCEVESGTLQENANLSHANIAAANDKKPMFTGRLIEFELPVTVSEYQTVKSNPYGLYRVYKGGSGSYYEGWILSMSFKVERDSKTKITLIEKYA